MKKISVFFFSFVLFALIFQGVTKNVWAEPKHFEANGEVTSVDPLYSRVSIKHEAIANFSESAETEFLVTSTELLKNINKRDLVHFEIVDDRGDVRIQKITKTGQATLRDDGLKVGQVVQDTLVATGELAKGVTSPIEPLHDVLSGAVGATTAVTGEVLQHENTSAKKKF